MLETLFNKVAACRPEGVSQRMVFRWNLRIILKNLYLHVTLFTMHEKEAANVM